MTHPILIKYTIMRRGQAILIAAEGNLRYFCDLFTYILIVIINLLLLLLSYFLLVY